MYLFPTSFRTRLLLSPWNKLIKVTARSPGGKTLRHQAKSIPYQFYQNHYKRTYNHLLRLVTVHWGNGNSLIFQKLLEGCFDIDTETWNFTWLLVKAETFGEPDNKCVSGSNFHSSGPPQFKCLWAHPMVIFTVYGYMTEFDKLSS